MLSDNPNVSVGFVDCLPYTRRIALKDNYPKKDRKCLHILSWTVTTKRLWHKRLSSLPKKASFLKRAFISRLHFFEGVRAVIIIRTAMGMQNMVKIVLFTEWSPSAEPYLLILARLPILICYLSRTAACVNAMFILLH